MTVISLEKKEPVKHYFQALKELANHLRIVVFVDVKANDVFNPYMLVWRVTNNMDSQRDLFVEGMMVGVDGTNKNELDDFQREWPDDVDCTPTVIEQLKARSLWDLDEKLKIKYQL